MADNDWAQQVAMNESVFATLISSGEDLSDGRHVIHYLYGGDIPALSEALSAKGYVVSPTATSPGVIAENFAVTDQHWSEATMKMMCDLANEHGAEYDGWEASMVRHQQAAEPPSSNAGEMLSKLFGKKD